jgi:hypothetical protein
MAQRKHISLLNFFGINFAMQSMDLVFFLLTVTKPLSWAQTCQILFSFPPLALQTIRGMFIAHTHIFTSTLKKCYSETCLLTVPFKHDRTVLDCYYFPQTNVRIMWSYKKRPHYNFYWNYTEPMNSFQVAVASQSETSHVFLLKSMVLSKFLLFSFK